MTYDEWIEDIYYERYAHHINLNVIYEVLNSPHNFNRYILSGDFNGYIFVLAIGTHFD